MNTQNTRFNYPINLDDQNELSEFIHDYQHTKGRRLANLLGFKGKNAVRAANALSNYAWNKLVANNLRSEGDIQNAHKYEDICDRIYSQDIQSLIESW